MLIGKIIGLLVFGAILAMPVHVLVGSVLAPWKAEKWPVMAWSVGFAYAVAAVLIFGSD